MENTKKLKISVIIPCYNESLILEREFRLLQREIESKLDRIIYDYEIIFCENGSTDNTREILDRIVFNQEKVQVLKLSKQSYGEAMKEGILKSRGDILAIFNVDYWDIEFLSKSLKYIESKDVDIAIASKTHKKSKDKRPFTRRIITRIFNQCLRLFFGFSGTDTHGIKVFKKDKIIQLIQTIRTKHELFDTEFLLKADIVGLKIKDLPIEIIEKRKTRFSLIKRLPIVVREFYILRQEIKTFSFYRKKYFYENIACNFDSIMNTYDLNTRLRVVFRELLRDIDLKEKFLLDAGCGTGWFSQFAERLGAKVYSLDVGKKLLKDVGTKCGANLIEGDIIKTPFSSNFFDVVVCTEVIEHVENQKKAINELYRVLKKNGYLALTTPNKLWFPLVFIANLLKIRKYEGNELWFSHRQLTKVLQEAGFCIIKTEGFHFYPFNFGLNRFNDYLSKNLGKSHPFKFLAINFAILAKK